MILETERLSLRRLTTNDAAFMLELMNEPQFIECVADRGLRTEADAAKYLLEKILPSYEKFGFGFYGVELKTTGALIGICGLAKRDTLENPDVGFAVLARHSGRGYTFEAASATMSFAREKLKLQHVSGITAAGNGGSIHLLEKLGLRYQGIVQVAGFATESQLYS